MSNIIHVFDLLPEKAPKIPSVCVVVGEDRFLKRLILTKIRHEITGDDDATELEGDKAQWRDVYDELSTLSLFSDGPRLVIVQNADGFVSNCRAQLEGLVAQPIEAGCLVLDLRSLASNTRLYKAISEHGLMVECKPPQLKRGRGSYVDENRVRTWLRDWGQSTHHIKLKRGADEELLQLVGLEFGLLDQELAKLALFCDAGGEVSVELVRQVVGGWRAKTTWELLDAILDGNGAEALRQLERLLQAGEAPQAIAGAMFWSLRRFADAAQLVMEAERAGRKTTLTAALEQAGVKKWPQGALARAERQLRQLGRHRAAALYQRLLELDLSMKGSHSAPDRARWALEKFLMSLSREAA